jgi:signal transduction histidine kinase
MRIGQKLILGFAGIALLIAIVGYVAINASQKALKESIGENSALLVHETIDKIDRHIYQRVEDVEVYSKNLLLKKAVKKSNEEFEKLDDIQRFINQKDQEWVSAPKGQITPFMRELLGAELSEVLREKTKFYAEKYGYPVFSEMYATNKYGVIIALTGRTSDYLQADEEWYQKATKEKKFWVGEVEYDESSGIYACDIVINLYDEDGNFAGILKAVLNIEGAIRILKELKSGHKAHGHKICKTMEFKLLTQDGRIIYSTEKFKVFQNIYNETIAHFGRIEDPKLEDYFIGPPYMPDEKGKELLFAHANSKGYKDFKSLGWILIIEHETEEIFAPVTKLRNFILFASLGIMMLAIFIGLFVSLSISNPVKKLKDATVEIGKGRLDTKIDIKSKDEIGDLADSFNKMTTDLKKAYNRLESYSKDLEEEVKKRTQELEEAKSGLEKAVDERTKELQQERADLTRSQTAMLYMVEDLNKQSTKLRGAQDALVRSERLSAIGQLASSVAHELRNPLGVMKNVVYYFNMLELGKDNDEVKENLDILATEIENSNKIISDLLEFARIKEPTLRPENINTIIKEVLNRLEKSPNIEVLTELGDTLPDVELDALQIQQVFYNIAKNAIETMDKGGALKIKTNLKADFIETSFVDTGSGISKENLVKIFNPLFSTKVKGTGLGLSVCQSLVEGHGGKIEVKSEVGKGTTFTVKLPVKRG